MHFEGGTVDALLLCALKTEGGTQPPVCELGAKLTGCGVTGTRGVGGTGFSWTT